MLRCKLLRTKLFDPQQQAKQDATELQEKSKAMKKDIEAAVQRVDAAVTARDTALLTIGNLVHESVPVDNDEASSQRSAGVLFLFMAALCSHSWAAAGRRSFHRNAYCASV